MKIKRFIIVSVFLALAAVSLVLIGCNLNGGNPPAKNGVYIVYEADSEGFGGDFNNAMQSTIDNISQTLNSKGYTQATVVRLGNNRIRIFVPDLDNSEEILIILNTPVGIVFRLSNTGEQVLTGDDIVDAYAAYDYDGNSIVSLSLNSSGASKFATATGNNIGQTMDIIMVDSEGETIISSPTINEMIAGGKVSISGMGNRENAERLAQQILEGKFFLKLNEISVNIISNPKV